MKLNIYTKLNDTLESKNKAYIDSNELYKKLYMNFDAYSEARKELIDTKPISLVKIANENEEKYILITDKRTLEKY